LKKRISSEVGLNLLSPLLSPFSLENGITTDIQEITIGIGKAGNY
jgi:hypothetical protein